MSDSFIVNQVIQRAVEALQHGDKRSARRLAERAVALAPDLEEPWLILAAVASARGSIQYLEHALQINPASERALKGMQWAVQRLREQGEHRRVKAPQPPHVESQPSAVEPVVHPVPAAAPQMLSTFGRISSPRIGARRRGFFLPLFLVLLCLVIAALAWPGNVSRALDFLGVTRPASILPGGRDGIAKPTYTPTGTATGTFTATVTFSPTPAATEIPSSTPTPTLLPTGSPTPFQPETETPTPTLIPDTETPLPYSLTGEKRIVVVISEQHMYVYEADMLVSSFVVSTGIGNSTRVGTFTVLDKIPNAYGSTWNIWMPNWLGIYYSGGLENGIHALPILSNGARLWAGYLGRPVSYGCVVLGVDESQWLYDWAEVGTVVEIRW